MNSAESKMDTIKAIKDELAKGNYDAAASLQTKAGLNSSEIDSIASSFFAELNTKRKFKEAVELGIHYDLPEEVINQAVLKNFTALFAKGEYEAAANWGMEHNLDPSEILKASIKLFEKSLREKNIPKALSIREQYKIPKEMLKIISLQAFNSMFQHKDYYNAAVLAKAFDFPLPRLLLAALKAFKEVLNSGNIQGIIEIEKNFNILSDASFDEIQTPEQEKVIDLFKAKVLQSNESNPENVVKILGELDLLGKLYRNELLRSLAKSILTQLSSLHATYLQQNKTEKALEIIERFDLYSEDVPQEVKNSILQVANRYHDSLLEQYNYTLARKIKEKYTELFRTGIFDDVLSAKSASLNFFEQALNKGDLQLALKAVKDYNLPNAQVKSVAAKAMIKAMDKNNYDEAFALFKQFQLNFKDENILTAAKKHFEEAQSNNLYELAADLGFFFNLDKSATQDAAYQTWKRFIKSGKYDKALILFNRHRLPLKLITPTIDEIYQYNIQIGQLVRAQQIRKEYHLKVGIMTLLREFLQKIGILKS